MYSVGRDVRKLSAGLLSIYLVQGKVIGRRTAWFPARGSSISHIPDLLYKRSVIPAWKSKNLLHLVRNKKHTY